MSDQPAELRFASPVETVTPSPSELFPVRDEVNPVRTESPPDPDGYITKAKLMVVENYNEHHDASETPLLEPDEIFVIGCEKFLDNWRVTISSKVVKGLLWIVTFESFRSAAYIEVFKKINNIRIKMPSERRR
jgi:Family of unknown function (DUF6275)